MTKKIVTCHFDKRSEEKSSLHHAKDFSWRLVSIRFATQPSAPLEMTMEKMEGQND